MIDPEEHAALKEQVELLNGALETVTDNLAEQSGINSFLVNAVRNILKQQAFMDELDVSYKKQVKKIVKEMKILMSSIQSFQKDKLLSVVEKAGYVVPPYMDSLNDDILDTLPTMAEGDSVQCQGCHQDHKVQCGVDIDSGMKSNMIMYYQCPEDEKVYICGAKGRSIMGYSPEEKEEENAGNGIQDSDKS